MLLRPNLKHNTVDALILSACLKPLLLVISSHTNLIWLDCISVSNKIWILSSG